LLVSTVFINNLPVDGMIKFNFAIIRIYH
jgi:hypothetical protein